jgi:redox-regulated HSP33 family molecular chaperone
MNLSTVLREVRLRRVILERAALQMVCACLYYDLADCIDEASDQELTDIINQNYDCELCGLKGSN